jgi:hypothetical protein
MDNDYFYFIGGVLLGCAGMIAVYITPIGTLFGSWAIWIGGALAGWYGYKSFKNGERYEN